MANSGLKRAVKIEAKLALRCRQFQIALDDFRRFRAHVIAEGSRPPPERDQPGWTEHDFGEAERAAYDRLDEHVGAHNVDELNDDDEDGE